MNNALNKGFNAINVTLGSYSEKSNYSESDIEYSILQQIIYTERPNKLPLSRLDRIDDKNKILETNIEFKEDIIF